MTTEKLHAVTGAYGYSGKYIAKTLFSQKQKVITFTSNPNRPSSFGDEVQAYPFNFDNFDALVTSLEGVDTFYNTYWVRFDHGLHTQHQAISNTRTLIRAAKKAGVRKFVHTSITNPSPNSPLPYFWGKAILEEDLQASGLSYAILRPAVLFGKEDVLINNICWFLRHLPVFGIPGDGEYKMQPIYVQDLADLAIEAGKNTESQIIDAIGPETFTFNQIITMLKQTIGSKTLTINMPNKLAFMATSVIGAVMGDVVLTWDEVIGLTDGLLETQSPPSGSTKLSEWVAQNKATIGKQYANELKRHFKKPILS